MTHLTADGLGTFFVLHPCAEVLDVRCAYEREAGHLAGDHHVPWYTLDWEPNPGFLDQVLQYITPEDCVLVICRSGYRSCEAAAFLETIGFKHVYNLLGGYEDIPEARQENIAAGGGRMLFEYEYRRA
jgi:rhodanese-related sulfurtransferase